MAKKKEISKEILELKRELAEEKAVIGTSKVLKNLKNKELAKVYLSSNCPEEIRKDLEYYGGLSQTPRVELKIDNEELGVLCKKYFFISVLGIKKE